MRCRDPSDNWRRNAPADSPALYHADGEMGTRDPGLYSGQTPARSGRRKPGEGHTFTTNWKQSDSANLGHCYLHLHCPLSAQHLTGCYDFPGLCMGNISIVFKVGPLRSGDIYHLTRNTQHYFISLGCSTQ